VRRFALQHAEIHIPAPLQNVKNTPGALKIVKVFGYIANFSYLCKRKRKKRPFPSQGKPNRTAMERTLVLLKPSTVMRGLIGEVTSRFEKKGLRIVGMKMLQLNDEILNEHYAHLVGKPFFPALKASMMRTPVIAMCLEGTDAIEVVRFITGYTNGRKAEPGTIRGDYCMSNQQNIVHASDSPTSAQIELRRFFKPEELFDLGDLNMDRLYALDMS